VAEEWKIVPSFPAYEASSMGRIRRIEKDSRGRSSKILTPSSPMGYQTVVLYGADGLKRSSRVNRIIAETFYGPAPSHKHVAAHWNGVRSDNKATNIRWDTQTENLSDRKRHGTEPLGSRNQNSKLTSDRVASIRSEYENGVNLPTLAKKYAVTKQNVYYIVN